MNTELNELLDQMRLHLQTKPHLHEDEGEEAWGPDSDAEGDTSGSKAGLSGAENSSNIWDAFDLFVGDIIDDLIEKYSIDDGEALDFILSVADDLATEGKMPPVPEEEDGDQAVAQWLGVAGSMGFERMVLDAAIESAEE